MIATIKQFVLMCTAFPSSDEQYDLFENGCSASLRAQIYALADVNSPEPFRSAMNNIGFTEY